MKKKPVKNIAVRHELILKKLQNIGRISIDELIEEMQVSGVTIRKDLKLLEEKNLLFRTWGGASLTNPYKIEKPIQEKELLKVKEKQQIARAALNLIGENDSIIIGSGTTVFELARCIQTQQRLTVITPALRVGLELCNKPNVDVLLLGGMVRPSSSSATGLFAEKILDEISSGILFLGVDGIDMDFGFSITNLEETSLGQKMIQASQITVIMADSSKFGQRGLGRICPLDHVQYIVTDSGVSSEIVEKVEETGVKVIIA